MSRTFRALLIILGTIPAVLARAQASPPAPTFGETLSLNANVAFYTKVAVAGVTPTNALISGTKVEVIAPIASMYRSDGPYTGSRVTHASLKIGLPGQETEVAYWDMATGKGFGIVPAPPVQPPGGPGTNAVGPPDPGPDPEPMWLPQRLAIGGLQTRFASTHFADGAKVNVKLEVDWQVFDPNHLPYGDWIASPRTTSTLPVTITNRALVWKTIKTSDGDYWSTANQAIIDGVITAGRSTYGAAKYGYVTTPSGTDLITTAQVIAGMFNGSATSLFGMTHGYNSQVEDSFHGNRMPFINRWKDVGHPLGYAINVFYSCETMVTNHADQMNYQHGSPPPGHWIDAGRVGFRVTVYPIMKYTNGVSTSKPLSLHATKFFEALSAGYMLDKARRIANHEIFGTDEDQDPSGYATSAFMRLSPTPSNAYSDPYATFRYVYLSATERPDPELPDTHWFYPSR